MPGSWVQALGRVIARIDWTDPQVQQGIVQLWRTVRPTPDPPAAREAAALARLQAALQAPEPGGAPGGGGGGAVALGGRPPGPDLAGVVAQLTAATGDVKESLRFAREDGPGHPEVVRRLAHAQTLVDTVERYTLRPEVVATWPPALQAVVQQQVLPTLRRARQALHNGPDGGPPTVDTLTQAAAGLGQVTTQLRVVQATTGPAPAAATPAVPAPPPPVPGTPSAYAPGDLDTGCLPCGRAHLGAAAGTLQAAADLARTRGLADPETQAALETAAEELELVQAYDWTPERIARSPAADRAILERYAPQVAALRQAIEQARDPAAVAALAAQAQALRARFVQDDLARASAPIAAAAIVTTPWRDQGQHAIAPPPWWTYVPPTAATVGATTVPTDTARAFDQLATALHDRGVRIRIRTTPTTAEGVLEGAYLPEQQAIILSPAALAKDAYAVQVLAHEAAHALADAPACHAYDARRPYAERPEEQFAEAASVIALDQAGLPVELFDGTEVPPGTRQVDWPLLEATQSPAEVTRLRWVSQWIADAIQGVPRDYATPTCPPGSEGGT